MSDEATASTTTGACKPISTSSSSLNMNKYVTMDKFANGADEMSVRL